MPVFGVMWVNVKEHHIVEISEALHCGVSRDHLVVFGRKTTDIMNDELSFSVIGNHVCE